MGQWEKRFLFFRVLSTCDHCHTLVKFLGKKEKHLGYRLPRALVENSRERWARGLFEGERDDIWRKNHLLSLNCKKLCRNLNFATEWTNNYITLTSTKSPLPLGSAKIGLCCSSLNHVPDPYQKNSTLLPISIKKNLTLNAWLSKMFLPASVPNTCS